MSKASLELFVGQDPTEVGEIAASFVQQQLADRPASVLLLPTGQTPVPMYRKLVKTTQAGQLDWQSATTFNLDEFYNLSPNHKGSFRAYMQQNLFEPINLSPDQINFLNSAAPDPVIECQSYEAALKAGGGVDLAVLGIGLNGHIGFNEPGSPFTSRTRPVTLQASTRAANAFLFDNDPELVPDTALTVGLATIMEARSVVLIATGANKATILAEMVYGPISQHLPATVLKQHSQVRLIVDQAAATLLRR